MRASCEHAKDLAFISLPLFEPFEKVRHFVALAFLPDLNTKSHL